MATEKHYRDYKRWRRDDAVIRRARQEHINRQLQRRIDSLELAILKLRQAIETKDAPAEQEALTKFHEINPKAPQGTWGRAIWDFIQKRDTDGNVSFVLKHYAVKDGANPRPEGLFS